MDTKKHEENINKEFESKEGVKAFESKEVKTTNLGKVDVNKGSGRLDKNDPEIKKIQDAVGYIPIDLSEIPSGGRFYRKDLKISIRAAKVGEIRNFSIIDENQMNDADERINAILSSCSKISFGNTGGSYKDILEEDRIYIILKIKELTFKEGENRLMMPVKGTKCSSSCESQKSVELRTDNLQFHDEDETLKKYYSEEYRCYVINTKNYGEIIMAPPTIGVMRAVTNYIEQRENEGKSWDKASLQILPYLRRDWRGFDHDEIFSSVVDFQGWDANKFSIIYRLAEKMRVGVLPELTYPCKSCGAEVTVPLMFPGGIKSLFVISDISSELL